MSKVYFYNPGILDLRSVTIMGINAKPNSSNPIGYFGTGFKYALAVCARIGAKVVITIDDMDYVLRTRKTDFRGKDFDEVYLEYNDGDPGNKIVVLPFTSELGKNWKPWMVVRELGSNARDEGGDFGIRPDEAYGNGTIITVEHPDVYNAAITPNEVFLSDATKQRMLNRGEGDHVIEIYPRVNNYIYYRGIRVSEMQKSSRFTFNIMTNTTLTEDRTLRDTFYMGYYLGTVIQQHSTNEELIQDCVWQAGLEEVEKFEYTSITFEEYTQPSATFMSVCGGIVADRGLLTKQAHRLYHTFVPRNKRKGETLDAVMQRKLERAYLDVSQIGVKCDLNDVVVDKLDLGVMGLCDREMKQIVLNVMLFSKPQSVVTTTLLEECLHLYEQLDDNDREMQNRLLELIYNMHELSK